MDFSLPLPSLPPRPQCETEESLKSWAQVGFSDLTDPRGFTLDDGKAGMRDILESIFQTTPEPERQGLGEMSS